MLTLHLRPPTPLPAGSPREAAAAFERVRADVEALPAGEVGRITAHVPTAVSIAVGALPNLEAMGEQIRTQLPHFDLGELAKLPDYARALQHAYLLTLPSAEAETDLQALLAEAMPLRERLLVTAEGLALFGLVDRERVAFIRSGTGKLDAANDRMALAQLLRAGGDALLAKTPLRPGEVERADELGWRIVGALGKRRLGVDGAGAPGPYHEACARLFRLLVRAYDQGRRALTYLRWAEGDANELMPSLFSRRRARGAPPASPRGEGGGEAPGAPPEAVD